ncbi:acyl carrier protein [Desulfonema ishimotonii]|uniref:Acyl carrier protein n=1 Tax=Desulfonema ishimotonii TaxID=45657 RepID=A0A401G3I6_9BACT|nr:acyl carrier protein [Desulfonema ishimotonii]GBC63763.1 acyl carrier protein [Desulfonema ishimotonii]
MHELLEILQDIRPEHNFSISCDFIGDGLLDSFDIVTLVAALEDRFAFSVNGEDVTPENFRNLEALERFVRGYLTRNPH